MFALEGNMAKNGALNKARLKIWVYAKIPDIKHHKGHVKDKVIFCNCGVPETSNFWKYPGLNFSVLMP